MSKFKVGDKVACYYGSDRRTGSIKEVLSKTPSGNIFEVMADEDQKPIVIHEKQCRKLIKKERKKYWLVKNSAFEGYDVIPFGELDQDYLYKRLVQEVKE